MRFVCRKNVHFVGVWAGVLETWSRCLFAFIMWCFIQHSKNMMTELVWEASNKHHNINIFQAPYAYFKASVVSNFCCSVTQQTHLVCKTKPSVCCSSAYHISSAEPAECAIAALVAHPLHWEIARANNTLCLHLPSPIHWLLSASVSFNLQEHFIWIC